MSIVVEEFIEFSHTLDVTEYLEDPFKFTGVEFSINLSRKQRWLGVREGTLAFAVMVDSANEDSLVICTEDFNLVQVERTKESALDLLAETRIVYLVSFWEEEH